VGQAVSNSALIGGTASIAGSYGFADPTATPSLGTHPVDVIFFPTESANYVSVTGTVQLAVTAAPTPATVTLSDLSQPYDGSGKSVTVTTDPADLATIVTYNGSGTLPINAGTYSVEATVVEAGYTGSTNGTLQITKIDPVVNTWPTATVIVVGRRSQVRLEWCKRVGTRDFQFRCARDHSSGGCLHGGGHLPADGFFQLQYVGR
jgi:hypothetical protein